MDDPKEVDNLLLEQEQISEEERRIILEQIDDEFRSFLHHEDIDSSSSVKSHGLLIPVIIGLTSLVVATIVIFIFQYSIGLKSPEDALISQESGVSSQWQILNLYLEESENALREKDAEIEIYQKEIRAYDQRINNLRELLRLKDETETRMSIERRRLSEEGLDEKQISERLQNIEREVTAGFSLDILEIYNLSIEEINQQIDRLLNEQTSSEEHLKETMEERDNIAEKADAIEENIRTSESGTFVSNDMLQTLDRLNSTISGYEKLGSSRLVIESDYSRILEMIENGELESALVEAEELERRILAEMESQNTNLGYSLNLEKQVSLFLKGYIQHLLSADQNDSSDNAGSLISTPVAQDIQTRPQESESDSQISPLVRELIIIGNIYSVEFNLISIKPIGIPSVQTGDVFQIYRTPDQKESIEIGSGIITEVISGEITGRLQTLTALSNKPEAGDEILISQD